MNFVVAVFNVLVVAAFAVPVIEKGKGSGKADPSDRCWSLMQKAGASDYYSAHVGHAMHSMSLHTLRRFKKDVGTLNGVPSLNQNLAALEAIHPNAVDTDTDASSRFASEGMWHADQVLSHMDDEMWDIRGFSILGRLVHALHMEELWTMILPAYEELAKDPPHAETCACARDTERTGIMDFMRYSGLTFREPNLISKSISNGTHFYNAYAYEAFASSPNFKAIGRGRVVPVHMLKSATERDELLRIQPPLESQAAWSAWLKMLHGHDHEAMKADNALFLYCALNHAQAT